MKKLNAVIMLFLLWYEFRFICNAFEWEITVNEILDPGKEERGGNP